MDAMCNVILNINIMDIYPIFILHFLITEHV